MSTEPQLPVSPADSLSGLLGFEPTEVGPELARASFEVGTRHKQVFGLVHGGTFAALAEELSSHATARAVGPEGMLAQGMSNNVSFLRPVFGGTVHAEARRRHRGRTTWVWDVDMSDDQGRLCAAARVTIALRPMPDELKARFGIEA